MLLNTLYDKKKHCFVLVTSLYAKNKSIKFLWPLKTFVSWYKLYKKGAKEWDVRSDHRENISIDDQTGYLKFWSVNVEGTYKFHQ